MKAEKSLKEKWRDVLKAYKEDEFEIKSFYLDPIKNKNYIYTATWSNHLSILGVYEYLLNKDIHLFKQYLKESIIVREELFEYFEKGKPVHPNYVSLTGFWRMFLPLVIGDMPLAKSFASHLGGRFEIEQEWDSEFAINFGYVLKYFIEESDEKTKRMCLEKLAANCKTKRFLPFRGYVTVFQAILENDSNKANEGFQEILLGHAKECEIKGDSYFSGTKEEDICLWGIGMANLAIYYGLEIKVDDPLIPQELLLLNE